MASTLNATTTGGGGIIATADASGVLGLQTGGTTAVTIDASQNVGIGTSSPTVKLNINGGLQLLGGSATFPTSGTGIEFCPGADTGENYIQAYNRSNSTWQNLNINSGRLSFGTASTERMRIDSSGNVLVGTTSSSGNSGEGAKILDSGRAYATVASYTTSANINYAMYSTGVSNYRFYVRWDGTIVATNTTITGVSDQRLKENIVDLPDGLDAVLALKPRKFDWKSGKGRDIKGDRGFIAQEFETVFPDMIEEWLEPAPEGEESYKAVNVNLIPTLVKAIQELKAIVDTQAEQIKALQGASV